MGEEDDNQSIAKETVYTKLNRGDNRWLEERAEERQMSKSELLRRMILLERAKFVDGESNILPPN